MAVVSARRVMVAVRPHLVVLLTLASPLALASLTFCPSAFHAVGSGCYFYGYFKLNWFRAMEFCHSLGKDASLVVIETEQENRDLKEWLTVHGDPNTGVWVGGSENGHRGLWSWFPTGESLLVSVSVGESLRGSVRL